jgi:hypothetical protein
VNTLEVNGSAASVIAYDIVIGGSNKSSAFSFPLPNKNSYHPVMFWLSPQIQQLPRPDMPGRLRISWDTLQAADTSTTLLSDTSVADVEKDLDNVERSSMTTTETAPEPVFVTAADTTNASSDNTGTTGANTGAAEDNNDVSGGLPWYGWAAIGLGVLGIGAFSGTLLRKKPTIVKGN